MKNLLLLLSLLLFVCGCRSDVDSAVAQSARLPQDKRSLAGVGLLDKSVTFTQSPPPPHNRALSTVPPPPRLVAKHDRVDVLLRDASVALDAGDLNRALSNYREAERLMPSWAFVNWVAGDQLYVHGYYAQALPQYRRMFQIGMYGTIADSAARMLACAITVGDEGAKKEAMARLGTNDPVTALLRGASSMEAMGDGNAMKDLVLRAKALRPSSPEVARMMGRAEMTIREAAESKARRAAQSTPLP